MDNIKSGGKKVFLASDYLKLDSDVIKGGGTDQTQKLQEILDSAPALGGLCLVMDGAALISGISIHSDTTIICLGKNCGFFLNKTAARSLIQNKNFDFKEIKDENIQLIGGTYNFNSPEQERYFKDCEMQKEELEVFVYNCNIGIRFYGIKNLVIKDATFINQRTFGIAVANWKNIVMENCAIELFDNRSSQNQDGIHFWGPGTNLSIKNLRGTAGDDFLALAPDELDGVSNITDVVIDGVRLEDSDQGIRLLSRDKGILDRVIIKNVTGTFKSFGFFINPWCMPCYKGNEHGNFKNITFENIDLVQSGHKYDYTKPFLFRLGGYIKSIIFKNIRFKNLTEDCDFMQIGGDYVSFERQNTKFQTIIENLIIDGLQIPDNENKQLNCKGIIIDGNVGNIIINNAICNNTLIETKENGTVNNMIISNIITDIKNLIEDKDKKIKKYQTNLML